MKFTKNAYNILSIFLLPIYHLYLVLIIHEGFPTFAVAWIKIIRSMGTKLTYS